MENYYEVIPFNRSPIVCCDEWTGPIDDAWFSYVVYPYGERAYDEFTYEGE